jgi:hypothetical protein
LITWLSGIHSPPPEYADAPPILSLFSTTSVLRPSSSAVSAATRPAAPDPTMRTSTVRSKSDMEVLPIAVG